MTDNVDFYNILNHNVPGEAATATRRVRTSARQRAIQRHVGRFDDDALSALMNGPIRKKLGDIPQNVTWGGMACMTARLLVPSRCVCQFQVNLLMCFSTKLVTS